MPQGSSSPSVRPREHWRSLEQLADTPEARSFLEREFPVGASELPEGIDRRSLVQLLGASLALAGLTGCRKPVENIVPYVTPPEELVPGMPRQYATTMPFGLGGYGLLVESHEGRPTKIEGNELHPATAGSASALMQASILGLYDPDRSTQPLQKAAGAAAPEKKTWADFVAAWKALEGDLVAAGGAGLAVLLPPAASPTLFRIVAALRQRFPGLLLAAWEPVHEGNAIAGAALLAGRPLRPSYDLGAARVVVSLDADLFLGEQDAVANARGFAAGRRLATEKDEMNRLWVVESAFTTTGGMADHRLALPSGRVGAVALALAQALGVPGVAGAGEVPGVPEKWLAALVKDLQANPGRGLVVAGRDQPAAVHALALAINTALGNLGTTVTLREPADVLLPSPADLAALAAALQGGSVSTLVVVGGNPAYDAPADLKLAAALAKVKNVLHLGHAVDETAALAHWHLPEAHFLEAWGDCRSSDGTASVVQPLIEPLFGGKSAIELLGLLATGEDKAGYDLVRETWQTLLAAGDVPGAFDGAFNKVLHDGLLAGSAAPAVTVAPAPLAPEALAGLAAAAGSAAGFRARPSPPRRPPGSSWCSGRPPRCTTAASPTSAGCRRCPMR